MRNPKIDILNFLKREDPTSEQLIELIDRYGMSLLFLDMIKETDKCKYERIFKRFMFQKRLNEIKQDDMLRISEAFAKAGIKVIFFKGLTLALDLYDPVDSRKSGDIDILIDSDDLPKALDIIGSFDYITEAYREKPETVSSKLIGSQGYDSYWLSRCNHVFEVSRPIFVIDREVNLSIDIHVRIFNNITDNWLYVKDIIKRAEKFSISGHQLWVLEIHDRLLQLLGHFTKEFIDTGFLGMLIRGWSRNIKLCLLYDIALFIDKYQETIDWDKIIGRAREWDKDGEILLAIKLFDFIFPGRISADVINELQNNFDCFFNSSKSFGLKRKALPSILNLNPKEVISNDVYNVYFNIYNKVEWVGPRINCPKVLDGNPNRSDNCFGVDDTRFDKSQGLTANYTGGTKNGKPLSHSAQGYVWWNDSSLKFNIIITNREYKLNENLVNSFAIIIGIKESDGKSQDTPFIRKFTFYLNSKDSNKQLTWLKQYIWTNEISAYPYEYDIKQISNGNEVSISMPWEFLGINPHSSKEILFDMELDFVNVYDNQRTILSWSNPFWMPYDDITLLGQLEI